MGPVKAVRGQFAQLVLPGDNPDVASLILEHESGALSTLNASYASASEYYLMNIYGKDATAYYDMHGGLRLLKRGEDKPVAVPSAKNDTFVEELEEFAAACAARQAGGRRRICDRVARRGARRHPVGARGPPGGGRGNIEERLIGFVTSIHTPLHSRASGIQGSLSRECCPGSPLARGQAGRETWPKPPFPTDAGTSP